VKKRSEKKRKSPVYRDVSGGRKRKLEATCPYGQGIKKVVGRLTAVITEKETP
jgi:hypothetical protein